MRSFSESVVKGKEKSLITGLWGTGFKGWSLGEEYAKPFSENK